MTNYEKAVECAENNGIYSKDAAMQMAEWKDQQFKEYLEKRKEELGNAILVFGHDIKKYAKIDLLNEIINELFGEEKK